jgi:branched-chain amino acid transport system substrate-binding protein
LVAFDGALYSATCNPETGTQIHRSSDGVRWEKVAPDGFGDRRNRSTYGSAVFDDRLFLATDNNVNGTQVWQRLTSAYLPLAMRNSTGPCEVFKLGILGPFSGPDAMPGDDFAGAVTMAFDAVDWRIGRYDIKPVWIDSECDSQKGSQRYEEAIVQQGVEAGLLNWCSNVAEACMEVVADHQVPHFAGLGSSSAINRTFNRDRDRYGYWTTKWWPVPEKLSFFYVQMLEQAINGGFWSPDNKTVAIVSENTGWGHAFADTISGHFQDAGWSVVVEKHFLPDQTDFSSILAVLETADPAVVASTTFSSQSAYAFINQAEAADLESVIIADGLGWMPDWYAETDDASNYVLDQRLVWASDESQAMKQAFEARYGYSPGPASGGMAYDATNFFIGVAQETYQRTGELSSETLYAFVKDEVWTGQWSYNDGVMVEAYTFSEETIPDPILDQDAYLFPVLQYVDGDGMIVFPPNWADQPFTPPGE